jgi:murein L,D-transpeptidase YafK
LREKFGYTLWGRGEAGSRITPAISPASRGTCLRFGVKCWSEAPSRIVIVFVAVTAIALRFSGIHTLPPQRASEVLVLKSEHKLLLLDGGNNVMRTYSIAIGRGGIEPKQRQGDHKTPEGLYVIDRHKSNSRFHRALHVSYPSEIDRERARKLGVDPGGDIMIHGIQNGLGWLGPLHRTVDCTDGCIAVTDVEIEEIYSAVPDGTPVEIRR